MSAVAHPVTGNGAPSRSRSETRAGWYFVCRFRGTDNGDLIVGVVESVRTGGRVVLRNLLTGNTSVKDAAVLSGRNARVMKREAMRVVEAYRANGKAAARQLAVGIAAAATEKKPQRQEKWRALVSEYQGLPLVEQEAFAREVWPDVLDVFGIQ